MLTSETDAGSHAVNEPLHRGSRKRLSQSPDNKIQSTFNFLTNFWLELSDSDISPTNKSKIQRILGDEHKKEFDKFFMEGLQNVEDFN